MPLADEGICGIRCDAEACAVFYMVSAPGMPLTNSANKLDRQTQEKWRFEPKRVFPVVSNLPDRPPDHEMQSPAPAATGNGADRKGHQHEAAEYRKQSAAVHCGSVIRGTDEIRIYRYGLGAKKKVSLRLFSHRGAGEFEATSKGFTVKVRRLPELIEILQRLVAEEGQP